VERAPVWFVIHCGLPPFLNSGKALLLSLLYLLLVLHNHQLVVASAPCVFYARMATSILTIAL